MRKGGRGRGGGGQRHEEYLGQGSRIKQGVRAFEAKPVCLKLRFSGETSPREPLAAPQTQFIAVCVSSRGSTMFHVSQSPGTSAFAVDYSRKNVAWLKQGSCQNSHRYQPGADVMRKCMPHLLRMNKASLTSD